METVTVDEVDPRADGDDVERRMLSAALGATDVASVHYRIPPGEGFPGGLHAHADQEEVFVVLQGEATFETLPPRREWGTAHARTSGGDGEAAVTGREVTVGAGEAVAFAPGEFQSGRNAGPGNLVALALGAPRDSADVRLPLPCPACGHAELRLDAGGERLTLRCADCGSRTSPRRVPPAGGGRHPRRAGRGGPPGGRLRRLRSRVRDAAGPGLSPRPAPGPAQGVAVGVDRVATTLRNR